MKLQQKKKQKKKQSSQLRFVVVIFYFYFFCQYIFTRMARELIEANVKASPWDNGSKEPCPRTQRSGHGRIRTEDRLIRSPTP